MTEPENQAQTMSEVGRLTGIIWEPRPVYEDLAARPRWWVPLILLTVLAVCYVVAFSRIVGWDTFMQQQFDTNPRLQQLSTEQRAQILEQQTKIASSFGYVGAAVGVALSTLVIGAVMLGVFNFLGGASLKFRQAFSITCYSFLPTGLSTILALVVMFLKNPADFDLQNPLIMNVGAFLDPQATPKWLHSMATSLDAFSIWVILLLALGFSVAGKNLRYSKALTLVLLPWVVYVALKSGWAGLFG